MQLLLLEWIKMKKKAMDFMNLWTLKIAMIWLIAGKRDAGKVQLITELCFLFKLT